MEVTKTKAAYFTRFDYLPSAGGGCRRFVQMVDDLSVSCDVEIISTRNVNDYNEALAKGIRTVSAIGWCKSYRASQRYLMMGEYWAKHIDLSQYEILFIDDPVYFPSVVYKAEAMGIPVIAVCHNIETLAEGQVEAHLINQSLKIELGILQHVNCVVSISREENFLFRNLGVNTVFYPYFPCDAVESRMLRIRQLRENNTSFKKQVLFFGSLGNLPTRIGLERLLESWKAQRLFEKTGFELVVTGFGSEQFVDSQDPSLGVAVLGPLGDEAFDQKLAEVECIVIYQNKGSGALTRISETLVAGVNILANEHAARSYHNLVGVIEYSDDFSGLESSLKRLEEARASELVVPNDRPDPSMLAQEIGKALGGGKSLQFFTMPQRKAA